MARYDPPEVNPVKVDYVSADGDKEINVLKNNAKNAATYANVLNQLEYDAALESRAFDKVQTETSKLLQDEIAADKYNTAIQSRDIQIDAQLEAFRKNQQGVAEQLKLNRLAAVRAEGQAESIYRDRIKNEFFKLEGATNKRLQEIANTRSQFNDAARSREDAVKNFTLNQRRASLQGDANTRQLDFQETQVKEQFLETQAQGEDARVKIERDYEFLASQSQFEYDRASQQFSEANTGVYLNFHLMT